MPDHLTKVLSPNTYRTLVTKVSKELDDLEFLIKRSTAEAFHKSQAHVFDSRCFQQYTLIKFRIILNSEFRIIMKFLKQEVRHGDFRP